MYLRILKATRLVRKLTGQRQHTQLRIQISHLLRLLHPVQRKMSTTYRDLKFLQRNSMNLKNRESRFSGDLSTKQKAAAVRQAHGSGGAEKALKLTRPSGSTLMRHSQMISAVTTLSGSGTATTSLHLKTGIPAMLM